MLPSDPDTMNDQKAASLLVDVLGPEAPHKLFFGTLATALLIGHYGEALGVETNNWLMRLEPAPLDVPFVQVDDKAIRILSSPYEGIVLLLQAVQPFAEVLNEGDIGRLAWLLLVNRILPMPLGQSSWRVATDNLEQCFDRLRSTLHTDIDWQRTTYVPPLQAPPRWNARHADAALQAVSQWTLSLNERLGLLAWAQLGSNYGLVGPHETHNWALIGQSSNVPLAGHVMDDTGAYAVRVYDSPNEGVKAFYERVLPWVRESRNDFGRMAELMLAHDAYGPPVTMTKELWVAMTVEVKNHVNAVAQELALPATAWERTYIPAAYLEKKVEKTEEEEEKEKPFPWGPVLTGAAALTAGGVMLHRYKKKRDQEKVTEEAQRALLLPMG